MGAAEIKGRPATGTSAPRRGTVVLAAPPETLDEDPPARRCADPLEPLLVPGTLRTTTALHLMHRRGLDHLVVHEGSHPLRVVSEIALLRHLAAAAPGEHERRAVDPMGLVARYVPHLPAAMHRSAVIAHLLAHDDDVAVLLDGDRPVALLSPRSVMRSIAGP